MQDIKTLGDELAATRAKCERMKKALEEIDLQVKDTTKRELDRPGAHSLIAFLNWLEGRARAAFSEEKGNG